MNIVIPRKNLQDLTKGKEYNINAIIENYRLSITNDNQKQIIISAFNTDFLICFNKHGDDIIIIRS